MGSPVVAKVSLSEVSLFAMQTLMFLRYEAQWVGFPSITSRREPSTPPTQAVGGAIEFASDGEWTARSFVMQLITWS